MRTRTAVTIGALVVVLVAAGGTALALITLPHETTAGSSSAPTSRAPTGPPAANTHDASDPRPSTGPTTGPTTAPGEPGPSTPLPGDDAQEPLREGGSLTQPTEIALPPSEPLPRILDGKAPGTGSSQGRLAVDFPKTIPVAPDSEVEASSLASEGTRVQATLSATTTMSSADLLTFYRTRLAKYGLYDTVAPATAESSAVSFTRDDDSITLSLTPVADGVKYVLFAVLTARG